MEFIKCSACGKEVPAAAKFCTFCGSKDLIRPAAPAVQPAPAEQPAAEAPAAAKKQRSKKGIAAAAAIVLILGLGGWLVMQIIGQQNAVARYTADVEAAQAQLNAANEELLDAMDSSEQAMAQADAALAEQAQLESLLDGETNGSHYFHPSSPVVVMHLSENEIGRVFLTTDYDNPCTVWYSQDTGCCELEYASDSWEGVCVELLLYPQYEGVTVFTFTNDQSSDTFDIVAVVQP